MPETSAPTRTFQLEFFADRLQTRVVTLTLDENMKLLRINDEKNNRVWSLDLANAAYRHGLFNVLDHSHWGRIIDGRERAPQWLGQSLDPSYEDVLQNYAFVVVDGTPLPLVHPRHVPAGKVIEVYLAPHAGTYLPQNSWLVHHGRNLHYTDVP